MRLLLFLLLLTTACTETASDPHAGALPHAPVSKENVAPRELSEADRDLIANAKGRSVQPFTYEQLSNRLEFAGGKLHLFNFWRIDCIPCRKNIDALEKIAAELGEDRVKLLHINMDEADRTDDVNVYIRRAGMTGEIFQLQKNAAGKNVGAVTWDTELPALYLIDNEDDTKLYYRQEFEYEELKAILGSFVM